VSPQRQKALLAAIDGNADAAAEITDIWEAKLEEALRLGKGGALAHLRDEVEFAARHVRLHSLDPKSKVVATFGLVNRLTGKLAQESPPSLRILLQQRSHARDILRMLAENEKAGKGGVAFSALQEELGMKAPNLSMHIKHLEANHAVSRERQGKAVRVSLTAPGRQYAIDQGWLDRPATNHQPSPFPSRINQPMKKPGSTLGEQ
jgi:DNA-binding transcriptional ArsR family regulator